MSFSQWHFHKNTYWNERGDVGEGSNRSIGKSGFWSGWWRIWISEVKSGRLKGNRSKSRMEEDEQWLFNRRKMSTNRCGFLVLPQCLRAASFLSSCCSSASLLLNDDGLTLWDHRVEGALWGHLIFGIIFSSLSLPCLIKVFLSLIHSVTAMFLCRYNHYITNSKKNPAAQRAQACRGTRSQHLCKGKQKMKTSKEEV